MVMNSEEAAALLDAEMEEYRRRSYDQLLRLRNQVEDYAVVGPSGASYGVEVQAFWDSERTRDLRVIASIDGGGISSRRPLCRDFIIAPDGRFIGEDSPAS